MFNTDPFGDGIKYVIQNQQGDHSGHQPGAERDRSNAPHAIECIKNRSDTGKGQPFHEQPQYSFITHNRYSLC